jgi:hypothetical protein
MANWGDHEYDLLFKANLNLEAVVSANYQAPVWGDHVWDLLAKLTSNIGNISIGGVTPEEFAALDLDTLPTSDPGDGKPWLNGGVMQVGP